MSPKAKQVKGEAKAKRVRVPKSPDAIEIRTPRSKKQALSAFQRALVKRGWNMAENTATLGQNRIEFGESTWILKSKDKEVISRPYGGGSIEVVRLALAQK